MADERMKVPFNRKIIVSFREREGESFLRIKLILACGQDEVSLLIAHRRNKLMASIGYRSPRSLYGGHYMAGDGWYYGRAPEKLAVKALACIRHTEDIVQNRRVWEILQLYFSEVYKDAQG